MLQSQRDRVQVGPPQIRSAADLKAELGRLALSGQITSEDRLFEAVSKPFGKLGIGQRWDVMRELIGGECKRGDVLNGCNWAADDYEFLRRFSAGQPDEADQVRDYVKLVGHMSGYQHGGPALRHMYGPLRSDAVARNQYLTLALILGEDSAPRDVKETLDKRPQLPFDEAVEVLQRVKSAEDRNGTRYYELVPAWRTKENFRGLLDAQDAGLGLQQSTTWFEHFMDADLAQADALQLPRKHVSSHLHGTMQQVARSSASWPWIDAVFEVERQMPLASSLVWSADKVDAARALIPSPSQRTAMAAHAIASSPDPARALYVYQQIAPAITPFHGFQETMATWLTARAFSNEQLRQLVEEQTIGRRADRPGRPTAAPPPISQQGDSVVIDGIRIPVRRQS